MSKPGAPAPYSERLNDLPGIGQPVTHCLGGTDASSLTLRDSKRGRTRVSGTTKRNMHDATSIPRISSHPHKTVVMLQVHHMQMPRRDMGLCGPVFMSFPPKPPPPPQDLAQVSHVPRIRHTGVGDPGAHCGGFIQCVQLDCC